MPLERHNSKPAAIDIRVLIVDDDQEIQMQHVDLLTEWGYTPFVAEGEGEALAASARELVKRHRCHIALVDKQLAAGGPGDWSGLELVPTLQPALSIIVSGSAKYKHAVKALQKYRAVGFVGKEDSLGDLREAIEEVLHDHPIGARPGVVMWPYGLSSPEMRNVLLRDQPGRLEAPEDEADELICRLFPDAQRVTLSLDLENQQNERQVSSLRRRSRVFLAFVDGAPVVRVVKMAPVKKIEREIENYDRYVEPNLVGLVRPEKYSQAVLWDFGAVAYSFLGNNALDPSGKLPTFFEHYRAKNQPDAILAPLHHFFDSCEAWYRLHFKPLDGSLFEAYDETWDGALSCEFTIWRKDDRRHTFASVGISGQLPQPTRWLVDHVRDAYQVRGTYQALTHGDFHGDNLFVDAHHAWPIDFERTGPGPILRDFVELIQDILTRIAFHSDSSMSAHTEATLLYELAVALCDQSRPNAPMRATKTIEEEPEADTAFIVVRELQQIARERSGYTDQREFLWGLLLNNLFVLRLLPKSSPRYRRTLLLASVICARLERWGAPWPTQDMQPVEWALPGAAREQSVSESNPSPPASRAEAPADKAPPPGTSFAHGYALVVGVGGNLPVTVSDAQALREVLVNPERCAYLEDHVISLTGSQATRQAMLTELDRLSSRTQDDAESTVVVYFSGHGVRLNGSYLLAHGYNLADLSSTAVSGTELTQKLQALRAKRLLVLLDCCHAGGMAEVKDGLAPVKAPPELVAALEQSKGRVIISSSHDDQRSYIRPGAKHSLFTEHLIEALNGAASEPGDELVKVVSHLFKHLSDRVPRSAAAMHVQQEPWIQASSGDFPVALLLGGKGLPAVLREARAVGASTGAADEERRGLVRRVFEALNALTDSEIDRLCLVEFEKVGTAFAPGMSRDQKINRLVEYCQVKRQELERLARALGLIA